MRLILEDVVSGVRRVVFTEIDLLLGRRGRFDGRESGGEFDFDIIS